MCLLTKVVSYLHILTAPSASGPLSSSLGCEMVLSRLHVPSRSTLALQCLRSWYPVLHHWEVFLFGVLGGGAVET